MSKPRKTHKTAVVIIPPVDVWSTIQSIREKHDRQFRRWMPHITLIYPFRPIDEFERILAEFQSVCREIEEFEIELAEFDFFKHYNENYTIWLKPEPKEKIIDLQGRLQNIVPDCDDVRKFKNGFTPHLSVGQVKGKENREKLLKELKDMWKPVKFLADSIFFIWRDDPPNDIFRIWRSIKFGSGD